MAGKTTSKIRVIAHRGASARAPEHTFAAFDLALAMGADVLEFDVRLTADRAPVLVHDETLLRTHGDPRAIADMTLHELRQLDGALSLGDVFARYGGDTRYLIDFKCPDGIVERRSWETVVEHGVQGAVEIQTFCRYGLRRARRLDVAVPLSRLYPAFAPSAAIRRGLPRVARFANAIGPEASSVDAALVQAAHRHGLRVQPWTVNDPAEMDRLLALGVDGLITDVPDRAVAARARARRSAGPVAAAA
jgi:glycerophosphoryl diester phosphodiesterase